MRIVLDSARERALCRFFVRVQEPLQYSDADQRSSEGYFFVVELVWWLRVLTWPRAYTDVLHCVRSEAGAGVLATVDHIRLLLVDDPV